MHILRVCTTPIDKPAFAVCRYPLLGKEGSFVIDTTYLQNH